jgi:capsular exopolysaccharide synthesis family protein
VESGNAEVVDRARTPESPSSPRVIRDVILAMLAGLVAGLAIAFIVDGFDRRVRTGEELEELTGLRSLVSIPERNFDPASPEERQAALEPYRILRNGLTFLGAGGEVKVVLVSSASSGEGRTTVAAGLARACALAGQSVVLVEADLRRPSFRERFKLSPDAGGLTSALAGEPVEDLLQPLLPGVRTLSVLPAGVLPSNPSEMLRGSAFDDLLATLTGLVNVVIIDGPPLVGVADGGVLLSQPRVDAVLVVARLRRFDRDDGRAIRNTLEQHRLVNAALVVNGARDASAQYGYYGTEKKAKA